MTAPLDPVAKPTGAIALDTLELTKRFGAFTALDHGRWRRASSCARTRRW